MKYTKYTQEHIDWIKQNHNGEKSGRVWRRMLQAFPDIDIKQDWVRYIMHKNGLSGNMSPIKDKITEFVKVVYDPQIMSIDRCAEMCSKYFNTYISNTTVNKILSSLGIIKKTGVSLIARKHQVIKDNQYFLQVNMKKYTKEQRKIIRARASTDLSTWYISRALKTVLDNNIPFTNGNVILHLNGDTFDDRLENLRVVSSGKTLLSTYRIMGKGVKCTDVSPELVDTAIDVAEVMKIKDK